MSFDLPSFIEQCRAARAGSDPLEALRELMRHAMEDTKALGKALTGQPAGEGQLFRTDDLTILNVTLPPGLRTPPHDHTMWALIGIYEGREDNVFYRETEDGLTEIRQVSLDPGDMLSISPTDIHAIANPLATRTRGLHVYGGDLPAAKRSLWNPKTHQREPSSQEAMARYMRELMRERDS